MKMVNGCEAIIEIAEIYRNEEREENQATSDNILECLDFSVARNSAFCELH